MPLQTHFARLRKAFAASAVAGSASLVLADAASASWIAPETGGSPNADAIHSLYLVLLVTGLIVFVAVEGLLLYTLWKFRASRGHEAKQTHGNKNLEIGLTVGATVLVAVLGVISLFKLDEIQNPPNSDASGYGGLITVEKKDGEYGLTPPPNKKAMVIEVEGYQYGWRFRYVDGNSATKDPIAYRDLYAPTNTTVLLRITSTDVNHAWWIPRLGGKFDAVKGFHIWTWFKIPGKFDGTVFPGQCAELCGRNHANMTASVHALSPAKFSAWLEEKKTELSAAEAELKKQRVIVESGKTLQ